MSSKLVNIALIALLCSCSPLPPPQDAADANPLDGELNYVQLRGALVDEGETLELRIENLSTSEDACFWAVDFPTRERANSVHIIDEHDRHREWLGPLHAMASGVRRMAPQAREIVPTTLRQSFASTPAVGDCILVELWYFPCADNPEYGTPLPFNRRGVARSAWIVSQDGLAADTIGACPARVNRALTGNRGSK